MEQDTVCFEKPYESALEETGKVAMCNRGREEEASILRRVDPQNSAEPGPASKKTTQIPPREQAPQNKQTSQ